MMLFMKRFILVFLLLCLSALLLPIPYIVKTIGDYVTDLLIMTSPRQGIQNAITNGAEINAKNLLSDGKLRSLLFDIERETKELRAIFLKDNVTLNNEERYGHDDFLSRTRLISSKIREVRYEFDSSEKSKFANNLARRIQQQIYKLQNPDNCTSAKKLVCKYPSTCGFGCTIHHVMVCLMISLATRRTLLVDLQTKYSSNDIFYTHLMPLSKTCFHQRSDKGVPWDGKEDKNRLKKQVLVLNVKTKFNHRVIIQPHWLFNDIAEAITYFSDTPELWFHSQIMRYIFRLQPHVSDALQNIENYLNITHPIVGVHVRRTDKSSSNLHEIKEYMQHVIDWYELRRITNALHNNEDTYTKNVFLSTDDPTILDNIKEGYEDINFITNTNSSLLAFKPKSRYTENSLTGLFSDVMLLSKCDYIVGDFSSNIFKLAAEIMQTKHAQVSSKIVSINYPYCLTAAGKNGQTFVATINHIAHEKGEISLEVGDVIKRLFLYDKRPPGFWFGENTNSSEIGLYPSYKVKYRRFVSHLTLFD